MVRRIWRYPAFWAVSIVVVAMLVSWVTIAKTLRANHPLVAVMIIIVVLSAVFGPLLVRDWLSALRRRRGLMELAEELTLQYADLDFFDLPTLYKLNSARATGSTRASKIISGPMGQGRVVYFDCGNGSIHPSCNGSFCAFHAPCRFKELSIRPEIEGEIALPDIDLDHAEFNDSFYVKCDDKKFAYGILHQRAMQFFLDRPTLCMQMRDDYFLFSGRMGNSGLGALPVEGVKKLIADAGEFADLLPNYMKHHSCGAQV